MKPLIEKVLRSGLIDKSTAYLMEKYGLLEEGASERVDEDVLRNATKKELIKIADELADEVEKEQRIKETYLDLDKLKWPARVAVETLKKPRPDGSGTELRWLSAVQDRMGRYYFRFQDVKKEWFVPGNHLRTEHSETWNHTILEVTVLTVGETPAAIQVTVDEED